MNKYIAFYAAYNASVLTGNPFTKEEVVANYTDGRTTSLRALSDDELRHLTASLDGGQRQATPQERKTDNLRKALISIFHKMDYKEAAKAAKAWAEKMGVGAREHNVKKPFNKYGNQELKALIHKAEIALADYQKGIRRRGSQSLTQKMEQ